MSRSENGRDPESPYLGVRFADGSVLTITHLGEVETVGGTRRRYFWQLHDTDLRSLAHGSDLFTDGAEPVDTAGALDGWLGSARAVADNEFALPSDDYYDSERVVAWWAAERRDELGAGTWTTYRPGSGDDPFRIAYESRPSEAPLPSPRITETGGVGRIDFPDGAVLTVVDMGEIPDRDTGRVRQQYGWTLTGYTPQRGYEPVAQRGHEPGAQGWKLCGPVGEAFTPGQALAAWVDFAQAAVDDPAHAALAEWAARHDASLADTQLALSERALAAGFDDHLDSWADSHGAHEPYTGTGRDDGVSGARWSPQVPPDVQVHRGGRTPRMTHMPWHRAQGIELGMAGQDATYWRCPKVGCRVWAGPYTSGAVARDEALDHVRIAHRTRPVDLEPVVPYVVDPDRLDHLATPDYRQAIADAEDGGSRWAESVEDIRDMCGRVEADPIHHAGQAATVAVIPAQRTGVSADGGGRPLPVEFANVVESWSAAMGADFPADGAIEEIDAFTESLGETIRQMGQVLSARVVEMWGTTPLVGPLLDRLDQFGDELVQMAESGDQVLEIWRTEFAIAISRQREQPAHIRMLNVGAR